MSVAPGHDMIEAGPANVENETNDFTVDWDGPNDPNNPKKLAVLSTNCQTNARLKFLSIVGHSARNGS